MTDWDKRFMDRAESTAAWSKDPREKVGCVIVSPEDRREISGGYNGFPRGIADDSRLLDKSTKNLITVHAEMNSIIAAARTVLHGSTAYSTRHPCAGCAGGLIQAGIKKVLTRPLRGGSTWADNCKLAADMLEEAGVEVIYLP